MRTVLRMATHPQDTKNSNARPRMKIRIEASRKGPQNIEEALRNLTTVISAALLEDYRREAD